jgi:hypothetical protein
MGYEAKKSVDLPVTDFLDLELHLLKTRPGVKPDAFVTELVKHWLAVEEQRLALRKNGQAIRGFQNAWRLIWLRFPGDDYWVRADNCRSCASQRLQKQESPWLPTMKIKKPGTGPGFV